jgi:hypothetical protein
MQPWDWIHNPGNAGYNPFNLRDAVENAGVVGSGAIHTPGNVLVAQPFFVGDQGLFVRRMGVMLFSTSAPGSVRLGIYKCPQPSAHDMWPSQKVADFGVLTCAGGFVRYTQNASPGSVSLQPGYYYAASLWSEAVNTYCQHAIGGPGNPLGTYDDYPVTAFAVPRLFSAGLPSTFPGFPSGFFGTISYGAGYSGYKAWAVTSNSRVTVTVNHSGGQPSGTAAVTTDTTAQVTVTHGNNTLASTVTTALLNATNITSASLLTSDGLLANSSGWTPTTYSQLISGALRSRVSTDMQYNPFIAIDPES